MAKGHLVAIQVPTIKYVWVPGTEAEEAERIAFRFVTGVTIYRPNVVTQVGTIDGDSMLLTVHECENYLEAERTFEQKLEESD